jgi:hypothetical protein
MAIFCVHMGLPLRPLIPLIIDPAERTGDDNESAPMASPCIQRHIRHDNQRHDGTQSTLSGASHEGHKVAMSPNGGDTSPPTKLPASDGLVALQCADCCAPQTQLRPMSGCYSHALIDATPLTDNCPPPAFAPSVAHFQPGTLTTIGSSNTLCVQSLTQQSTVSGAVVAGQPAANCKNVDGGLTQEMAALETDCSGSPGATLNVGPTQGMVVLADCLGTRMAAPNIGLTWLGARSVRCLVGRLVGWSASWSDGHLNGSESLEAALNAHAQPAMPTPTGNAGARVRVPPGNAIIGDGLVRRLGGWSDGQLVSWPAGWSDGLGSLKAALNAPVQHTLPAPMGSTDARVTVPPENPVNGEGDNPPTVGPKAHTPCMLRMEDELWTNDPLLQIFTGVDWKLHGIFGDTIHHNDGCHLDGGIGEDKDRKWQRLHEHVVTACLPLYSLPNGWWAKQFLALQTALWCNVRLRGCNLEKACIFAPLILRQVRSKKTMIKVKMLVWSHMDAWEAICFCALVKEVEECAMEDGFPRAHPDRSLELESVWWRFNSMVHSGKLRAAVRAATNRNPGGLYAPNNVCTKTGHQVLDLLREKHPGARIPKELAFDNYTNSVELLKAMPIACYKEQISLRAVHLSGRAGPCGVDGTTLKE